MLRRDKEERMQSITERRMTSGLVLNERKGGRWVTRSGQRGTRIARRKPSLTIPPVIVVPFRGPLPHLYQSPSTSCWTASAAADKPCVRVTIWMQVNGRSGKPLNTSRSCGTVPPAITVTANPATTAECMT